MAKSKRKANSRRWSKSKPKSKPLTIAGLKRAIETRKATALAGFYTYNAVVQIIDRDNPPSKPRNLEGKGAITSYFEDVCGRNMNHKVENAVVEGKRLAFTQSCAYPDGIKVFCCAMADLRGGKISRQVVVQAWDHPATRSPAASK
jgi:SnoaL-like domain